jgi:hypothetical protein
MPQERENQYPHVTLEVWEAVKQGVPRELLAARVVMSNRITGIPHRPYLTGESDHAPVLQGIAEFTTLVYALVDAIDRARPLQGEGLPSAEQWERVIDANAEVVHFMENPNGL